MAQRIEQKPNFLNCFSNKGTFSLSGEINRYECRFWSEKTSFEKLTKHLVKLNVWVGNLGVHLIEPVLSGGV